MSIYTPGAIMRLETRPTSFAGARPRKHPDRSGILASL